MKDINLCYRAEYETTVKEILINKLAISSRLLRKLKLNSRIFCNGKVAWDNDKVNVGDVVLANIAFEERNDKIKAESGEISILYEDDCLLVILFEVKRGGSIKFSRVFMNILKNPLVVAGVSGAVAALLGIKIPDIISQPFITFGNIAAPLALVALGGMISAKSVMSHRKYLSIAVIGRLVFSPMLMLSSAVLLGMRGDVLIALLAVFGSPTAISSAPMAQAMGGNGELAGEIVAISSVCSILSVFLFVFTLSRFGFI